MTQYNPIMHNELTNLLPLKRQRALSRDYFLRLGAIGAILLSALTFSATLLLVPTYLFLVNSAHTEEARLTSIEETLASSSNSGLFVRLAALTSDAATLTALANAPSASAIIRSVLAISRPGITLSGFTYTPATAGTQGTLAISGTAATRDVLRNYQLALQGWSFATSATLPVSTYAMDANIMFTITVTLAP